MITDLELLKSLVATPSIFPDEFSLSEKIKTWIENQTEGSVEVQTVEGKRSNLIITKKATKSGPKPLKAILLAGHMDTVPVTKGWDQEPFEPQVREGKLFGLGAWDMKAGLYIMLQCLKDFQPQYRDLKVVFTVDEENYSIGTHKLIDGGYCDDVGYILVPEPGLTHGDYGITIGRTGRATFKVTILGTSAHGSFPQQGVNAISQAAVFLAHLKEIELAHDEEMGDSILFPGKIESETAGFSVPDICQIDLEYKMVPPDTAEKTLEKIRTLAHHLFDSKTLGFLPQIELKTRPTPFCSPYKLDKDSEFVEYCREAVSHVKGDAIVFFRESVADECIFVERLGVPAICIGPTGENAHKANEYVYLKSVEDVKRIYMNILTKLDSNI
jgi:succinyl-diaminopimelate desuccinylase